MHRVWAAVVTVLLIAVLSAVPAELVAQHAIRDKVAGKVPALGHVSVSENGSLALWDMVNGYIPQLDIASDDATLGQFAQVSVNAQLDGVALGGTPTVASTHAEITVPILSIASVIQSRVPSMNVSEVATDPAAGTVTAAIGPGGIGQLTLKPELADGKVTFSTTSLTVLGRPFPLGALGQAGSLGQAGGLGQAGSPGQTGPAGQQAYPLGLKATGLTVGADSVQIELSGGRSTLTNS